MTKAWPVSDLDPKAPLKKNARKILAVRVSELFSHDETIHDLAAVHELHNARISAKRLRYTLELFATSFGKDGASAISTLKVFQEELGLIHDCDVLIALVEDEISVQPEGTSDVLESLATFLLRLQAERVNLHSGVVTSWNRLVEGEFRTTVDRLTRKA